MIIGNYVVWLIPPARRMLDEEAKPIPWSFKNSQKQLLKLAYIIVPVSLALSIIWAVMSWFT